MLILEPLDDKLWIKFACPNCTHVTTFIVMCNNALKKNPLDYYGCVIDYPLLNIYSLPAYSAVDCGDPGTPTNGQRSLSSTTYTSVVTYTCGVGYTLQGSNSRTCQSNGQWSGSVPQCNGMSVKHQLWHFSCNTICYNVLGTVVQTYLGSFAAVPCTRLYTLCIFTSNNYKWPKGWTAHYVKMVPSNSVVYS